jgi:hypothetical protein
MNNFLYIFIGWLLGLFSPLIVDEFRKKREIKDIKLGIKTELDELRFGLAVDVYIIESDYGKIDRDILLWLRHIFKEYDGMNDRKSLLEGIELALSQSQDTISILDKLLKKTTHKTITLKKFSLPFLDSRINSLSWFNPITQRHLLEIKTRIGFINDEIESTKYYLGLTFQKDISPENYKIAIDNEKVCHKAISKQAKLTADLIGKCKL